MLETIIFRADQADLDIKATFGLFVLILEWEKIILWCRYNYAVICRKVAYRLTSQCKQYVLHDYITIPPTALRHISVSQIFFIVVN